MQPHKIVSREEWIEARKVHMAHEKEFTRARDRLAEPLCAWNLCHGSVSRAAGIAVRSAIVRGRRLPCGSSEVLG